MDEVTPTENELLEALRKAEQERMHGDAGLTANELADLLGWSKKKVYEFLRRGVRDGTVDDTGKRRIRGLGGRMRMTHTYRFSGGE